MKNQRTSREIERAMINAAHRRKPITYSELVAEVKSVKLIPNSSHLDDFLTELSKRSNKLKLGLLSVVVVTAKTELPGTGFFELARSLNREFDEESDFFKLEFNRVCEHFQNINDRIPPVPNAG